LDRKGDPAAHGGTRRALRAGFVEEGGRGSSETAFITKRGGEKEKRDKQRERLTSFNFNNRGDEHDLTLPGERGRGVIAEAYLGKKTLIF